MLSCQLWHCSFIYIPLCFYFIEFMGHRVVVDSLFTFHYASTLSHVIYYILCNLFNLHSTMLLLYHITDRVWMILFIHIYIPLCFYFIHCSLWPHTIRVRFTFHYASTLSKVSEMWQRTRYKFTFHYASTLSLTILKINAGTTTDLHSTMLLLYRGSDRSGRGSPSFTFHYASTLSQYYTIKSGDTLYLHSTMLLLYLETCREFKFVEELIYIPLCFYFIAMWTHRTPLSCLIYIPLCFYFIDSGVSESIVTSQNLHSTMLLLYQPVGSLGLYGEVWIYIPLCFYFIGLSSDYT